MKGMESALIFFFALPHITFSFFGIKHTHCWVLLLSHGSIFFFLNKKQKSVEI